MKNHTLEKKYKEEENLNKKQIAITLGIMCLLLTIALCVQIRTMNSASSTVSQTLADNDLRDQVLKMKEKYDETLRSLENAQKDLEKARVEATKNDETAEAKEQELKENNMLLGITDVTGDGVEVFLQDSTEQNNSFNLSYQLIHYSDIQMVVNELKNAGAEAIEVNGQRIVPTSSITCEGNIIKINGERIGSPFIIRAIGSQSLLYGGLSRVGSILDAISDAGNTATVTKVDNITIPKYSGVIDYEYLKEDK